jgi:hypothetical protein
MNRRCTFCGAPYGRYVLCTDCKEHEAKEIRILDWGTHHIAYCSNPDCRKDALIEMCVEGGHDYCVRSGFDGWGHGESRCR